MRRNLQRSAGKWCKRWTPAGTPISAWMMGAGNETWAAVPQTKLEIGEQITLKGGTVMRNFNSKNPESDI